MTCSAQSRASRWKFEPPSESGAVRNTYVESTRSKSRHRVSMMISPQDAMFSPWRFVESGWFQAISAATIIANLILVVIGLDDGSKEAVIFWPSNLLLCFNIFELVSRRFFFKELFLNGPWNQVIWNYLDIAVIACGMIDLWMGIFCSGATGTVVALFKLSRVFRVFRLIRVILEADLEWTAEESFQSFIGMVIGTNALLMGLETDIDWRGWFYIEHVLLSIYCFEWIGSLKRLGTSFFARDNADIGWNALDTAIVGGSVLDSWLLPFFTLVSKSFRSGTSTKSATTSSVGQAMRIVRIVRLVRILRLVKLVKFVRPLLFMIVGVIAALQGVVWVLILTVVCLYAAGIVTTRLIGHKMIFPPDMDLPEGLLKPWLTVPESMFTLFRVMSGSMSSTEQVAIDELMRTLPSVKFAFVFFMITSSWTLLSILTAVVSENMITTTQQQYEDLKLTLFEEERVLQAQELCKLFGDLDRNEDGLIHAEEVEDAMRDEEFSQNAAVLLKMPKRDILDVLKLLIHNDVGQSGVQIKQFVECLMDSCSPVTEKCIMKLESKLAELGKSLQHLEKIVQGQGSVGPMRRLSLTSVEARLGNEVQDDPPKSRSEENAPLRNSLKDVAATSEISREKPMSIGSDRASSDDRSAAPGQDSQPYIESVEQLTRRFSVLEKQHREDVHSLAMAFDSKLHALQVEVIRNLELSREGMPEAQEFLAATHKMQDYMVERFNNLERRHQDCFHTLVVKLDKSQDMLRDRGKKEKDKVQWSCPVPVPGGSQVLREAFPQAKNIVDLFSDAALQDEYEMSIQESRQERGRLTRQNAKDLYCSRV